LRLIVAASPSRLVPNSQAVAGMGTGEIDPEKLVELMFGLVVNRSVREAIWVN